jgi:hypothetical protein
MSTVVCGQFIIMMVFFTRSCHHLAPKGDEQVAGLIRQYHRTGTTDRNIISRLLLADHGIKMGHVAFDYFVFDELNLSLLLVQLQWPDVSVTLISNAQAPQLRSCQLSNAASWFLTRWLRILLADKDHPWLRKRSPSTLESTSRGEGIFLLIFLTSYGANAWVTIL